MKTKLLLLILFVYQIATAKIDTLNIVTKITNVTVFYTGAQVSRSATLKLKKGKYVLLVEKLPMEIDSRSMQIQGINNCRIITVKYHTMLQSGLKKLLEEKNIEAAVEMQEERIKETKNKTLVFETEEKILLQNSSISKKDEGTTVLRIKETADFYRIRLNEIAQQKLKLEKEAKTANKKILELYADLNEFRAKARKNYSQVYITIDCEKEISDDLILNYYVSSAGWEPTYDFRVDDIVKPFNLVYNANVFQSSGEDWMSVKVKLSNSNPALSGNLPKLPNWYLGRKTSTTAKPLTLSSGAIKVFLIDEQSHDVIPFANLIVYKDNHQVMSTITNIDGTAFLKPLPIGNYMIKAVYVGYKEKDFWNIVVNEDKIAFVTIEMNSQAMKLDELRVANYAAPLIEPDFKEKRNITREDYQNLAVKDINAAMATSAGVFQSNDRFNGTLDAFGASGLSNNNYSSNYASDEREEIYFNSNAIKNNVINAEYLIEEPLNIYADGEDNLIKIKEVNLTANYFYRVIPKLETDVFLTAQIPNWTQLNLLSGKANIYFEGTYVGQSILDVGEIKDTLSVSLGRDKNFVVQRIGNKQLYEKRISGTNIKETIGWDIIIKNNRSSKVKMIIEDQFPLSERNSIEVERFEIPAAKVDDKTGLIKWEFDLELGEKKNLGFKYIIKYHTYTKINVE
jgi:hypothetical protein